MRTDAKIGFAIGGVLLAVLTVYAIVVPKHKKSTPNTVTLVTPVPSSPQTVDGTPLTPPMTAAGDTLAQAPKDVTPLPAPVTPAPAPTITAGANDDGIFHPAKPMEMTKADDQKPAAPLVDQTPIADAAPHTPKVSKTTKGHSIDKSAAADDSVASSDGHPYVIKSGQTLSSIAAEVYGNSRFWVAIQRENKGLDANHLKVGSKIILPDITPLRPDPIAMVADDVEAPAAKITSTAKSNGHTYIVKSGDSLYGISKRLLGSGRKADALYALNKDEIGPDKSKLKLGMVLKLPVTPAVALAGQ
jgi:nucleoid-associated protein YgaU